MTDVTQILNAIEDGDPQAAEKLLPLVYEELRNLARHKMAQESPDHTLQATALVHEAYIRLVGSKNRSEWDNRGHFFAAAAEAMRRILVESARRKKNSKHNANRNRIELAESLLVDEKSFSNLIDLDDALSLLAEQDPDAAEVFQICFFGGFSVDDYAQLFGKSRATAYRQWSFARAWLRSWIDDSRN